MYRIDILKKDDSTIKHLLVLDGVEIPYTSPDFSDDPYLIWSAKDGSLELSTNDDSIAALVSDIPFSSISPIFSQITLYRDHKDIESQIYLWHQSAERNVESWELVMTIGFHSEYWKLPFSIKDFGKEMKSLLSNKTKMGFRGFDRENDDIYVESFIDIFYPILDTNSTLRIEIDSRALQVNELIEKTTNSLYSKLDENSLIQNFKFPEGLQAPCEEYLWSFVQFLKEVGVEATAELKQDKVHPGQVLFSVTPAKGKAALSKVKQALECYIEAAGATNFEFNPDASISALKFEAQVRHFQSQFALSQAQVRALEIENRGLEALTRLQEATILSHQTTIQNITANNVFLLAQVDSWQKEKAEKSKDEMRFMKGIVSLKEYRVGPFTLNAARFLYEMQHFMQDDSVPDNLREDVGLPQLPPHNETKDY